MVLSWLSHILHRFSWKTRTFGRGRRRIIKRKWVPWPNFDRMLFARLRFNELEDRVAPAIFTVTNTNDSGAGSLRQAILDANAFADGDVIHFSVGTGPISIAPLTALPTITQALSINATTQPGYSGTPIVELRGDSAGAASGFTVAADGSQIRGFVINHFVNYGIVVSGPSAIEVEIFSNWIGANAGGTAKAANGLGGIRVEGGAFAVSIFSNTISGNSGPGISLIETSNASIRGNIIGLDANGDGLLGNSTSGIQFGFDTSNSTVGGDTLSDRNIISGNGGDGVLLTGASPNDIRIQGNYIGTNAAGTAARGNAQAGVRIVGGGDNNTIGGFTPTPGTGLGNIISGNAEDGIVINSSGSTFNRILGNMIGLGADGSTSIGNRSGVSLAGPANTTIGGDDDDDGSADGIVQARNVISSSNSLGGYGIRMTGDGATRAVDNVIAGNYIGTTRDGTVDRGNFLAGIGFTDRASNNTIGGTTAGAGNVISGNEFGILLTSPNVFSNTIAGNFIGTNAAGTAPLGDAVNGVFITNGAGNNTIGGATAAHRNIISGNAAAGVLIDGTGTTGNRVSGNYIGTDVTGLTKIGNGDYGVLLYAGASSNVIGTNGDGTTDATEGNLISGNAYGIFLQTDTIDNVIAGNFIGTNAAGTAGLGNAIEGIRIFDDTVAGTRIGTNADGVSDDFERNVISSNANGGINVGGGSGTVIAGNLIGTNTAGTASLGGQQSGITLDNAINSRIGTNADGVNDAAERNVISGQLGSGVIISGTTATNNTIAGNYIGTKATGTAALPNESDGIQISNGASNNTIGGKSDEARNIISGNLGNGIVFTGIGTSGNRVEGNYIGLNADGTAALGNGGEGVAIDGGAFGNVIGGPLSAGNVISGNAFDGVGLFTGATGNVIWYNRIGTNPAGTSAIANGGNGITLNGAPDNDVLSNLISGNGFEGVEIYGSGSTGNLIADNLIGTNATGTEAIANGDRGVRIEEGASSNTVGGTTVGERNLISGNLSYGVEIAGATSTNNTIAGNYIGTNAAGTAALGNKFAGVIVSSPGNTVGGPTADSRNVVSGNLGRGVLLNGGLATGNLVRFNYIGTNATGDGALGNIGDGVDVEDGTNNTVRENVIAANDGRGISTSGPASGLVIAGNLIGTNATGTAALGNIGEGILIFGVPNVTVGGTTAADRNVISGNASSGITITLATAIGNTVVGNYIGTNAAGTAAVTNAAEGVRIEAGASGNTIGGSAAGSRNIISGNTSTGVLITGTGTNTNVVAGNYIGLNAAGNAAIANNAGGVRIRLGAQSNRIGTNADGVDDANERNVVSGNTNFDGVSIRDTGSNFNVVAGNYLGTDATGLLSIPNSDSGASLLVGSQFNRIGTSGLNSPALNAVERNIIAGNAQDGIFVSGASNSTIAGNYIGLNANGVKLQNGPTGIVLVSGANNITIGTNSDGQGDADERNVISGNAGIGVLFAGSTVTANKIHGNSIGTNPAGTAAIANGTWGVIVLNGSNNQIGGNSTLGQGNIISGNTQGGVAIFGTGAAGNAVRGNLIGVNAAGTAALGNAFGGVYTGEGSGFTITGFTTSGVATGTIIGGGGTGQGNVISGNGNAGVFVRGTAASATIQGNLIGTNAAGTAKLTNSAQGITVDTGASNILIGTNGDGTDDAAERNIISGNTGDGILVNGSTVSNVTIAGNYIGLNAAGNAAIGNAGAGGAIFVVNGPTNVLIGGTATGTGNVISGSTSGSGEGIEIELTGGTKVYGNIIGLDATGTIDLGNAQAGVFLDRAFDCEIGGPTTAHRNIISGNNANFAAGVWMNLAQSTNNKVYGNYIGTDITGSIAIPNLGGGVRLSGGATGNFIGTNGDGTNDATEGNLISGNAIAGVIFTATGTNNNVLAGNWIGLNAAGSAKLASSGQGLLISAGASGNRIGTNADGTSDTLERNIISGHTAENVWITGANTNDNIVRGNYVGTNPAGTVAITNGGGAGFAVIDGPQRTKVIQNVISGNKAEGLLIGGTAAFTEVEGNFIGTNAAGTAAIPNQAIAGIYLRTGTQNNRIGTNADGVNDVAERNIISGNSGYGILVSDINSKNNSIAGNYIGTNAAGNAAIANAFSGVQVQGSASDNRIGTNGDGVNDTIEGNLISGNSIHGIAVTGAGTDRTIIAGNIIGTDVTGNVRLLNGTHGVVVVNGADDTRIGTDGNGVGDVAERNLVTGSFYGNIILEGSTTDRTVIAGNYIGTNLDGTASIANGGGGIELRYGVQNTRIGTDGSNDAFNANERNVISGNSWAGIVVQSILWDGSMPAGGVTTDKTIIAGNYIGLNAAGTAKLPNASHGIYVTNRATNVRIGTDGNGIADAEEMNVISGNVQTGVWVEGWTYMGLYSTDQLVSGAIPRTTATENLSQADLSDASSPSNGNWPHNNPIPGGGGEFYAFRATGTIQVNTAGTYTFALGSDNGGRLRINGADVVVDDTSHNFDSRFGNVTLAAGTHTFEWVGFETTGAAGFELAVAVGAGKTGPVTDANGWRVLGSATPHAELSLSGSISTTAYYPNPGPLNTTIAGNLIGTDPAGTAAIANGQFGIVSAYRAANVRIGTNGDGVSDSLERNVISGNASVGVYIYGEKTDNNVIAGNYIGVNKAGTAKMTNGNVGVIVEAGPKNTRIGTDGSNDTFNWAERNVISGNALQGVRITGSGTDFTVVAGNLIGTNATGTATIGNGTASQPASSMGLHISSGAQSSRIGTDGNGIADDLERNVISGNVSDGIKIQASNNNVVAGNYIGLDALGSYAIGNGRGGVFIQTAATGNRIGTNADGINDEIERNIISGNATSGVLISDVGTSNNTIAGNFIGTDATGSIVMALPNVTGVRIQLDARNNIIGGQTPAAGNFVADNNTGILIDGAGTSGNSLRFNRVTNNLVNFTFTNGANGGIVAPSIIGASSAIETTIFGIFQGTPNTTYFVDVYDPFTLVNPSTRTYLASTSITTGPTGLANFAATIPGIRPFDSLLNVMLTSQATGDSSPASIPVPVGLVVVEGAPTGIVAEGTPITFTTRASDPGPGETISYEWRVTRNNVTFDSGTESTFTFVPDDNGTYVVTLSSATSTGLRDTIGPFAITVGNASPYIEFVNPPANVAVGVPVSILAAVSDAGTADVLTFEWLVNGVVLEPDALNPRLLTLVPSQAGPISVQLRVTDDDGETSILTYAMLASGGLPSAVIDVPSSGKEGTVIHARAALSDILAQDNLTFAWSVTKNGVPFASSGVESIPNFEFTPDDNGEFVVSLTVGVPNGPSFAAQNRSVFVQNIAPEGRIEFDADGNGIADESIPAFVAGTPIPFLGIARDVGVNDIHTFEWSVKNLESNLVVRRGAGSKFDFSALAAGTYVVTLVTRDDDDGQSTATRQIDVAGGTRIVSITLPPTATEGAESVFGSAIAPAAPGIAFRYEWNVRKDGQVIFTSTSPTYTTIAYPLAFTPPDDGTYEVSLLVIGLDGSSGFGTASFVVNNVSPTATIGVSAGPYFEGSAIVLTANASDPAGSNDTLSYQWLVNGVVQAGAKSSEFSFVPADNGSFLVEVVVRDEDQPPLSPGGVGFINLVVENIAPTLNLGSATDANGDPLPGAPIGYAFNFTSGATDPGTADTLTHAWSVNVLPAGGGPSAPLPATFTSDPTAKYFSFNLNPAQPGTYILTVMVEDDDGGAVTEITRIVAGSNAPDVISVLPSDLLGGASQVFVFGFGDNDIISASSVTFPVILDGGDGNDTLTGGSGNDVLFGGDGTDLLEGGMGNDTLVSQHGNDTLAGGTGNDEYVFNPGSDGTLNELGASGIDTINFAYANSAILFDLRLNDGILRPVDSLGNRIAVTGQFEVVIGSNFGDRITASSGTTLFGGAGADELRIESGTANVTLFGGEGEDHLVSAGGLQVTLSGGDGNDLIEAIGGTTLVTLFGGAGDDDLRVVEAVNVTLFGGEGLDVLTLTQATNVTVFGGEGSDTINLLSGTSIVIVGSEGQVGEVVPGLEADVTLFGGTGSDDDVISLLGGSSITVFGGEGADAITLSNNVVGVLVSGGNGEDVLIAEGLTTLVTLFGGEGNDQFILLDGVTNVIVSGDDGRDLIRLTETVSLITLFGGEGDDRVELLNGVQQVVVSGGAGIDEVVASGSVSHITLFGGEGDDRVTLQGGVQSVLVSGDTGAELIIVEGTANQITLFGGDGNDAINVMGGANVTVFGGEGNDAITVTGIAAGVTVFGGEGNDNVLVTSTGLNITVSGGEGNDTIETASIAAGNVTLFGGEGDDHLIVTAGTNVTVFGETGSDLFEVLNGTNVTVFGGEGDDEVTVRSGLNVTVFGGEGDDRIQVDGGLNVTVLGAEGKDEMTVNAPAGVGITLFGGEGDDVLSVLSGTAVTIFGSEGNDAITVGGGTNVTVFGGEGNDSIVSNAPTGSSITLFGGEGDDSINVLNGLQVTIFGESGLDVITVEGGTNVTVFGGEGEDKISVEGGLNVTVLGGEAADQIMVTEGTNVTVFGGEGNDTLTVLGGEAVTVLAGEGNDNLVANTASGVTMFGGAGDDKISAIVGEATTIFGESGNDLIELMAGSNITVFGGDGNDSVSVGQAVGTNVTVFGGEGSDTIRVSGGIQVTVLGEGGHDTLIAEAPSGTLITLFGGSGDDTIYVTAGSQMTVFGESGNDLIDVASTGTTITIFGGSGDDQISATAGANVQLLGDRGNDRLSAQGISDITLFGGAGNDLLQAGGGLDVELFGDDGDDYYKILASASPTRVRVKEIQTLGEDHDPAEKLFLGDEGGTSHLDRGSTGAETLDLSDFFGITINLSILGSDKDPLAGWQTITANNGWSAILILHGYFENVVGTAGNDLIIGNDFDNILVGGQGNDTLTGRAGHDSLAGGEGDDFLEGGDGDDTYFFSGANPGNDTIEEAANADVDTLDFSGLPAAISINLGATGPQVLPDGGVALTDATSIENLLGTAQNDVLIGNSRPNRIEGGAGDDALFGQAGDDTYAFPGEKLGTDTITEQSGVDTLDFSGHLGGIVLDLSSSSIQWNEKTETGLVLANPEEFEGVIGSSFGDRFIGNVVDNVLIGGGGLDYLDGGAGNNILRGGSGQIIYLDFTSHTDAWEWQYDAAMRDAIWQRMSGLFKPFGYEVVQTPPSFGSYLTVAFNDGPQGGAAGEIDFRNLGFGGVATVNVTDLLPLVARTLEESNLAVPTTVADWTPYVVALSATIAAHEAGHYLGLRHGDAYGPIGTGVNSSKQAARYLPTLPASLIGAVETKYHVMASPEAHGVSLLDSAGSPFFGIREAIKLAFADTGTTIREGNSDYNQHNSFNTALPLGRLTGLSVPNTLLRPSDPFFGQSLSVAATTVVGSIVRNGGDPQSTSENDVYSFAALSGEIYHFEINSYNLARIRNPIDSVLRIYDSAGQLLLEADDEFETADAVIVDWVAPRDGEYYLVVDTYTPDGIRDFDTGNYELFAYRAAAGADLGLGDTIVSSGGADQILTSTGRDRIKVRAGASAVIDVKGEADPIVDTTEGGTYTAYEDQTPVELPVISENTPPTLGKLLALPLGIPEGQTIKIQLEATDIDPFDRLTYRVEPINGFVFPSFLTVGAVDGILQWTPQDEGTFGFRIAVADIVGAEAIQNVIVLVDNLDPSASVSGPSAVSEGSSATFTSLVSDPGPVDVLTRRWTIDGKDAGTGPSLTFTPQENRIYSVGLTVEDGDGGSSTVLQSLAVNNLPPVARIDSVTGIPDERSPLTFTGFATDAGGPGDLATLAWTVRKNGSIVADGMGTTFHWTPDDDGLYDVAFTATDVDGGSHSDTRLIRVFNRAPVVAPLTAITVVEGDPVSFLASFADNPSDAPFTLLWRVTSPSTPVPDGAAAAFGFTTTDSGTYTVLLKVTDKDGASTDVLTNVTVTERAPTASLGQNGPVFETDPVIVNFTNPDDAPADLAAGLKYSFALTPEGLASTYAAAGATASGAFVLPDNGTYTVYGRVIDQNGVYSDYSTVVVVNNSAPKATMANAGPVVENSPVNVSFIEPIDGSADLGAGLKYSFALSSGELAGDFSSAKSASSATFTFADNGTFTVYGRVFDKDGAWTDYTTTVTVTNAAPTAAFANTSPVNENSPAIVSFTNAFDVSPADLAAGLKYSLALSPDGLASSYATASSLDSKSFTFTDNGNYPVYGKIFDKDGGVTNVTSSVTVLNVGPTAGIAGPTSVIVGQSNLYTLTALDPSPVDQAAGFTFEIDWNGDGIIDQSVSGPSGTTVNRSFPAIGTSSVRIRATDKDLQTGFESVLSVTVSSGSPTVILSGGNLIVTGTILDNVIRINRDGTKVNVRVDGKNYGSFPVTGTIAVFAGEGHDDVRVDTAMTKPAFLYGQDGNDTLRGGGGIDRIDGGNGSDSLIADTGNDVLLGGAGDDVLNAGIGNNRLEGGDGNDLLIADFGNDSLFGGPGNDTLRSGAGNDLLEGGDGDDSLVGTDGRDLFRGGAGNDTILCGDSDDTAFGEAGNDSIVGDWGNDSIDGGEGNDTISGGDGRDTVFGGVGNDSITGGLGNDYLDAGEGNDIVSGGAEDDTIFGGAGDDRLEGNADNDRIDGGLGFADSIVGGDGNDLLTDEDGVALMSGGAGADTLTITFAPTWNLGGAFVVPSGAISGGDGNDTIRVTANHANLTFEVEGNGGNDIIELYGTWKLARIFGGSGTDRLRNRGVGLIELHGIEIQE